MKKRERPLTVLEQSSFAERHPFSCTLGVFTTAYLRGRFASLFRLDSHGQILNKARAIHQEWLAMLFFPDRYQMQQILFELQ